jgi:ribokinase
VSFFHCDAQRTTLLRRNRRSRYAQPFYCVRPEKVAAVDSTGAGDAFSGTLCAALMRFGRRPFRDAAMHANRAAAMSTEIVGTAPAMVSFDKVVARFGA